MVAPVGLTVDLQRGPLAMDDPARHWQLIDLAAIHALAWQSDDEAIVMRVPRDSPPDRIVVVANANQLAGQQGLVQQLGLPMLPAVSLADVARRFGVWIEPAGLVFTQAMAVLPVRARHGDGIAALREATLHRAGDRSRPAERCPEASAVEPLAGRSRSGSRPAAARWRSAFRRRLPERACSAAAASTVCSCTPSWARPCSLSCAADLPGDRIRRGHRCRSCWKASWRACGIACCCPC